MERKHDVRMQLGVRVLLRDGTHLSAILYRPANPQSPTPAIFTLTPYIAQVHHDQGVFFAANGYPYLTVNVRGRGDSEGTFEADGSEEARDAYDITEWLARQPFCNGKVTMWGGSYSGYVQWAAAKEFPPHLATIVPVASPFRGVDSPMRNNIFATYRIQWLTYLSGRAAHDKVFADQVFWRQQFRRWLESGTPFRELDTFVGNPSAIFRKWVSHPRRDAFWDAFNPAPEDYARIAIPILTITGIYDGNQPGALAHYREHMRHGSAENRARHYLIIGPWDHGGTRVPRQEFCGLRVGGESLIDLPRLHLEWYAWTMAEGPKPEFLKRNVAYYVMGAERWRYADSLDAITARVVPLYLHSSSGASDVLQSGSLLAEPDEGGTADQYTYDPRDVSLAELESSVDPESRTDQHMVYASVGRQLVYHSAPYQVDTEVSGFFRLTLWISIDRPDTDFQAAVYEVALDGSVVELATDCMRARYRESLREEKLVQTVDPLRYEFDTFTFVSRRICKGHRLRLVFGPINSIFREKNYNGGGVVAEESMADARSVTVKVLHDASHPSALHVPLGHPED